MATTTELQDDETLARRLVGTWVTDPADKDSHISTVTYRADGTGTEIVRRPAGEEVQVTLEWSVKDTLLHMSSVASSNPTIVPVGLDLKDRILSLSDDRFVFEAHNGYGWGNGLEGVKVRVQ